MLMHYKQGWGPQAVVVGREDDHQNRFNRFIGSMLWSDWDSVAGCDDFLKALDEVGHKVQQERSFCGNGWFITIRNDSVLIEFAADQTTTERFTIEQVRRAVTGWRKLLTMPDTAESQVIVEL